jgi:hypothetical protein
MEVNKPPQKEKKVVNLAEYLRHESLYLNEDACKPCPFEVSKNLVSEWKYVSAWVAVTSAVIHQKPLNLEVGGNETSKWFTCFDQQCPFFLSFGKSASSKAKKANPKQVTW